MSVPSDRFSSPYPRAPRVTRTMPVTLLGSSRKLRRHGAILDLSDHGLRIATDSTLQQGQVVRVLLNDTGLCFKRCRVVWTRSSRFPELNQAGLEVLR